MSSIDESDRGIPSPSRELSIEFAGSAREYFRIWIVNLCLTLLTAGIFSAWAKVRKKRYFYSRTLLDGTPFQYLGQPIPILKGRVLAAIAFAAYYISTHFFAELLPYIFVAGAVLGPWVIIRSAAFNARYSSFRNMTFRFDGKYTEATRATFAWVLVPIILLGSLLKWPGGSMLMAPVVAIFGLLFPWWIKRLKGFIICHTSYGGRKGEFSATGGQFFGVYFRAGLLFGLVVFIAGLAVGAVYSFAAESQYSFLIFAVPAYAGYVLAYAYVKAHGDNLTWNRTQLGQIRFTSTLRALGLAKLYMTNALAIIASLGLLTPWAVMRTLKYRADHLSVLLEGDISDFQGDEASTVQAVGEEFGDFFDMDISI